MFVGRLALTLSAIATITTVAMVAWGGPPPDRASRYVPPTPTKPGVELGARLFATKGCAQCHSVDGSPRVGPPLSGDLDEAFIRESLMSPLATVRAGYQPVMPSFDGLLREREVTALVAYIKSLRQPSSTQ